MDQKQARMRTLKSSKLPAFLRGVAASHLVFSIPAEQRATYATAVAELKKYTCNRGPAFNRDNMYAEFECRYLRLDEHPAVFRRLWLRANTWEVKTVKFKLLGHNATPTLDEILSFTIRCRRQALSWVQRLLSNSQQGIKGCNHSVRFYVWNREK